MSTDDKSPMLSKHSIVSGDEPMLSKRDTKGLGKRQLAFLEWLTEQNRDVSWKDAWVWVGERTGYLEGSRASQNRMHPYIGKTLFGLVSPLEKRGLIVVLNNENGRSIRALVKGDKDVIQR